ncbi:MAG: putative lipoprotein [Polaromonas sp.]|nr:putative lipoprotein [Polaromonas sp.]
MNLPRMRARISLVLAGCLSLPLLLTGCGTQAKAFASQEDFSSTVTYSRLFDATAAQTCEAARRALLSQGYIISTARVDIVEGRKSFQPEPESHLQMEIRFVCAPDTPDGKVSLGFVTALQDVYALKKSNNSASLGVGALGSVSLPFSSSNDAMVKVGSKTISNDAFYDRFFDLVKRYLVVEEHAVQPK